MPQIQPAPFVLKDVVLTLGADTFEKEVSTAELAPSSSTVAFKGLSPTAQYTDATAATWVCNLVLAQDWETSGSLSLFLWNNDGTPQPLALKPRSGSGPSFTASAIIIPPSVGGAGDAYATSTIALGLSGKPLMVPAAGVAPVITTADATGPAAGGTGVAIFGAGFLSATNVKFGTISASSFRILSDTLIVAIPVAHAAGSQPVTVINATGASNAQAFSFV